MFAVFVKDTGKLFAAWLDTLFEDEDEGADVILEKSNVAYHLLCDKCNHTWWSVESSVKFCPNCGKPFDEETKE